MHKNSPHRVLNLNAPAGKILAAIILLGGGIPLLLYLVSRLLASAGIPWPGAGLVIRVFVFLGLALLALFLLLVAVEQVQDAALFRLYRKNRRKRLQYSDEFAECPFCGNRRLRPFERVCPVCGQSLDLEDQS